MKRYGDNPLIKELESMKTADATRARNVLRSAFRFRGISKNIYDISRMPREDLLRINKLGPRTLMALGKALERMNVIPDAEKWAVVPKKLRDRHNVNPSHRSIEEKLDKILAILKGEEYE